MKCRQDYSWWKFIHYNYFHKRLFKEYYTQKKRNFTKQEIKKYKLFIKLDYLISLKNIKWLSILIFKLES
jgi:hypothetical protein